jgi:hypothetical protein
VSFWRGSRDRLNAYGLCGIKSISEIHLWLRCFAHDESVFADRVRGGVVQDDHVGCVADPQGHILPEYFADFQRFCIVPPTIEDD